ncbi:hypothetical protein FHY64_16720 [Pelagovum pacificum]|uniref:Uncharacterized protein n=1 Tax=Pelagovum pacificum TaxID=2588711 RepID=A0A5C5GA36_9RHOB|nr:hypothetical protein FHY64_16720 [Pelagovum pacificum]
MRWQNWTSARPTHGSGSDVIVKIVLLFLIGMGVLAMFGKLRLPGPAKRLSTAKCRNCGRPRIGKGPCPCGKGGT